jgi:glycosyltransferase involved in cell wall biosynthesis
MRNKNIIFHGFVDDLEKLYDSLDIVINPVRCGAGLKIKNVEALTHGIPLITTSHGASGIEDGASKAFLIGNTPNEYLLAFNKLVENYDFRKRLSENAFEYAQLNFSEKKCYADIFKILK